ncbi:hypothetical protein H261_17543 [Paramagnetospirillum caucaseum]|uniref:Uncharacterized protein n=2 Tax=Paramagnetospirillum caucaseum TaxID=1244869 RepID=M2Y6F0_9PROT|nr:hypothetical protein H261_17543 [Paramagnetospirillum caucaseum]
MMGRFLLVRSAVMANAHRHIQNLGDLKAQFESALDLGIQDHPKPMTKRRREQGLYSSYLSDRCADLGSLVEDVLIHVEGRSRRQLRGGIYTHRWSHSAVSNSSVMRDEVGIGIFDNLKPRHTDLVNTSFWMPDRPDLQPVIAHEVAHNVIQHAYGDLEPHVLKTSKGSLPRLIRLFSTTLDSFGLTRFPSKDPRHAHDHALGELTCDLLAATVTGPAYLFALVQEIIGAGMDCLFRSPQDEIDFELADTWLDEGWAALNIPSLEWHLRLRLVCAWIKGMGTSDPLATRLCEGVETLCEILLQTIVHLGPRGIHDHVGPWQDMSHVLIQTARKSDALGEVKDWWKMRQDYAEKSPFRGGETQFVGLALERPTACADLPQDTRLFIQELLIEMKLKEKRPFAGKTIEIAKTDFPKIYGLTWKGDAEGFSQLFEHLHDVPWQSAMLRARDFLHHELGQLTAEKKRGEWLTDMSSDGAPGRELYQIALELFYWHQTSPADPIRTILRLWREKELVNSFTAETLRANVKNPECSDEEIKEDVTQLEQWWTWVDPELTAENVTRDGVLHEIAKSKITDIAEIAKKAGRKLVADRDLVEIGRIVKKIHPKAILHVHFNGINDLDEISQGASRSFFIRIQMMKLQQLRDIVAKYKIFDSRTGSSELLAISDHLDSTCHVETVRRGIQSGFLESADNNKKSVRLFLLERCAASRFGKQVAEELEEGPYTLESDPHKYFYHPLMGRYDLFGINSGDLPMRPRMPLFTKPPKQETPPLPSAQRLPPPCHPSSFATSLRSDFGYSRRSRCLCLRSKSEFLWHSCPLPSMSGQSDWISFTA